MITVGGRSPSTCSSRACVVRGARGGRGAIGSFVRATIPERLVLALAALTLLKVTWITFLPLKARPVSQVAQNTSSGVFVGSG